jgi:hypothetical protein
MGTVTISATEYSVLGDHTGAGSLTEYAAGSLLHAATFTAATADNRARAHVAATRAFQAQRWAGTATGALSWPREGVTDEDGEEVSSASVPERILHGVYELALAGLADSSIFGKTSTTKNVQSVGAGSASVSFFGPTRGGRFPDVVMELVGWAYATSSGDVSSSGLAGSVAYGYDAASAFDDCDDYGLTGGG